MSLRAVLSVIVRRRKAVVLATLAVSLLVASCAGFVLAPIDPAVLSSFPESRRLLDRSGGLLRESVNASGARVHWVGLDEVSPLVVDALLATEDNHFYDHPGIDARGVLRAAIDGLAAGRVVSGASTLTMQLSRLLFDHPRTAGGKLAQVAGAFRLEHQLDKSEILEQYLNRAPFGAGSVGIEAASLRYFGKPSGHLSLAEAALLAGLPQAPSALNPLANEQGARERQHHVLARMLATDRITDAEHERARKEPLHFVETPKAPLAMHFTDYVLSQHPPAGEVRTTLDLGLEQRIEDLVREHVRSLTLGGLTNAAVVVLDNRDCAILAMAGSTDYWDPESGAVNGALARRQPGSTLKPFTYALSFESPTNLSPAAVLADVETTYLGSEGELFRPQNYSDAYSGPVLLADALGRSLNVPAIRVASVVGADALLERLRAAGFRSLDREASHYGIGLTLGNGEVTLLELAQGYAVFARSGMSCTARGWDGAPADAPKRIFSAQTSSLITSILGDEELRARAFGASSPLMLGFPMAVKTGTSTNWRDSWTVGYTARYTVAVWTGDFEGRPMNQLSGALGAGPLFHRVAQLVAGSGSGRDIPRLPDRPEGADGVEEIVVCSLSGMAPGDLCPYRRGVVVAPQAEPRPRCNWHRSLALDRRNGLLASSRCPRRYVVDRVFEVLPAAFAEWEEAEGREVPPRLYSPDCPEKGVVADALVITEPRRGDVFLIEPGYERATQSVRLEAEVDPPVDEVTWLVTSDGAPARAIRAPWPYAASWRLEPGHHRIELVAGDERSDPVEIEVIPSAPSGGRQELSEALRSRAAGAESSGGGTGKVGPK